MKKLLQYKAELEKKLEAVNQVIADMNGSKSAVEKSTKPKKKMSKAVRSAMSAARKEWWAKKKAK